MKDAKHFNIKLYEIETKIKMVLMMLLIFTIGLFSGIFVNKLEIDKRNDYISTLESKIYSLEDLLDEKTEENLRLETILNNYTIQERREIGE